MDQFGHWIIQFGWPAIFVMLSLGIICVPIPDESLLMAIGYLIFAGQLDPVAAVVVAIAGCICGITVSYAIGRWASGYILHHHSRWLHISKRQLARGHRWFDRWGKWWLTFGYFLPGIRHITAVLAGTARLRWPTFALFAYAGAVMWVSIFITLGYFAGSGWYHASDQVRQMLIFAAITLAVFAGTFLLIRRLRARRAS